jgi:hypothetical protein
MQEKDCKYGMYFDETSFKNENNKKIILINYYCYSNRYGKFLTLKKKVE